MNVRVLAGLQRTARPPDDLAVLRNTSALRNVDDADLMAKCDALRELACRDASRSLILAEQPSRRGSGALLHLEFYAAEKFHQIEELAVDLDRINRRPAMEPLAPTSGISGAPLPKGGSFLDHGPSRSALVP